MMAMSGAGITPAWQRSLKMRDIRIRVRYPHRPHEWPTASWGYSVIEVSPDADGWVRIQHVRGEAPPAGLVPALLIELGLVAVHCSEWDGQAKIWVSLPEPLRGIRCGFTRRTSSSGAIWAHAWELDHRGHRLRKLASWHESMAGKLNEPVEGFPAILFRLAMQEASGAADFLRAVRSGLVRAEEEHPVQGGEDLVETMIFYLPRPKDELVGELTVDERLGSCPLQPRLGLPALRFEPQPAPEWAQEPMPPPPPCGGGVAQGPGAALRGGDVSAARTRGGQPARRAGISGIGEPAPESKRIPGLFVFRLTRFSALVHNSAMSWIEAQRFPAPDSETDPGRFVF